MYDLKSARLLLPALRLQGPVEFLDCDRGSTLVVVTGDRSISCLHLQKLPTAQWTPIRFDIGDSQRKQNFLDVRFSPSGELLAVTEEASFTYNEATGNWGPLEATLGQERADSNQQDFCFAGIL